MTAAAIIAAVLVGFSPVQARIIGRDLQVAGAFWGRSPACGLLTITLNPDLSSQGYDGRTNVLGGCQIEVDDDVVASPPWVLHGCAVVVHEVGHALGMPHSQDPASVMYGGQPLPVPMGCSHHWQLWTVGRQRRTFVSWRPFHRPFVRRVG